MDEVAHGGRTIVFVSHNMAAVDALCQRVILLEGGRIRMMGSPRDVIPVYLAANRETSAEWTREQEGSNATGDSLAIVTRARILCNDVAEDVVPFDRPFTFEITYQVRSRVRGLVIMTGVMNAHGQVLWVSHDTDSTDWDGRVRPPGEYISRCHVPARLLRPGRYSVDVCAQIPGVRTHDCVGDALGFHVSDVGLHIDSNRRGVIAPWLEWEVEQRDHLTSAMAAWPAVASSGSLGMEAQ
jgi:lipopolysaccharide transport system ATP-binding protein